ncbi:MAG: putative lipid II flippase FtsW [Bryobacteraceae bacterium]|nr:putative lipid II flippase FtsW [Bryobacteraceae bacterium]MDW8379363.1 putative peptidoglycan glycosyltransferase FtsW [Bryobacterales bacterium]
MAQRLKTDWTLFFTVVLMVCFGLVMIYSASSIMAQMSKKFHHNPYYFLIRQMAWAVLGFLVLMYFKRTHYRQLATPGWAFAPLGFVLVLLAVAYLRDAHAHRWLKIGGLGIQPAEFAKPALAIFLAWFVTRRAHAINTRHTILPATLALAVLGGSVIVADLGTAAILLLSAGAVFCVAGLERRYFLAAVLAFLVVVTAAVVTKPYRILRILGFIDPHNEILSQIDPQGRLRQAAEKSAASRDVGYQVRQSKIAIGTGGVLGLGLMNGKQKLLFLPEAHNDFIFAVICEELGLVGGAVVIAGFLLILWRGFRLYWAVADDFGRYLAVAITTIVVSQAFVHMSVVVDILPNKGIPLPMVSYGGSSLLSTLACLGMLMSVSDHAS